MDVDELREHIARLMLGEELLCLIRCHALLPKIACLNRLIC